VCVQSNYSLIKHPNTFSLFERNMEVPVYYFLKQFIFWTCDLRTGQVCTQSILYVRFWCTNLNIRVYQILTNGKPDWHSTCWCYVWAFRFQPIFLYTSNCLGELITSYTCTFVWREGLINNKLFIVQPSIIWICRSLYRHRNGFFFLIKLNVLPFDGIFFLYFDRFNPGICYYYFFSNV